LGDGAAFGLRLASYAIGLGLAALVAIAVDLARAKVTVDVAPRPSERAAWTSILRGLRMALGMARRDKTRAVGAWAWRWAAGAALVALAAITSGALDGAKGSSLVALWA